MRRVLAVSPHLDDAVFSAGGTLARHAAAGDRVTVLTCFTGNVERPTGFALACQLDKGLSPDIDYMALRRAEDEAACRAIGAAAVHLTFLEAPHRGYDSAAALFGARRDDDRPDDLAEELRRQIAHLEPDLIYGPYGIGNHVDHLFVRDALSAAMGDAPVILWEDFPYAMRAKNAPADIVRSQLGPAEAKAKLTGVLAYGSQLGFQFGSPGEAAKTLAEWTTEGFTGPPR